MNTLQRWKAEHGRLISIFLLLLAFTTGITGFYMVDIFRIFAAAMFIVAAIFFITLAVFMTITPQTGIE